MQLILMGTGPFAVPSFEAIRLAGYSISHLVTRPVVVGSGKNTPPPSPVRIWAEAHSLPISDPAGINDPDSVAWLKQLQADLFVVCDYGQILSRDVLSTSRLGGINLHGSLLPRHRGAAPVQWSILRGDSQVGVSIIHMTPALDSGPILQTASTPSIATENAFELEHRLSQLGVEPTLASLKLLSHNPPGSEDSSVGLVQDKSQATKAPRLTKEDGELNPHYSVTLLDRLIRALQPWPGTFANLHFPDGKSLRVLIPMAKPTLFDLVGSRLDNRIGQLLYGIQLKERQDADPLFPQGHLLLCASDGLLEIPHIQPAGKRLMSADEFVRGYSRYATMTISGTAGNHRLLNVLVGQPGIETSSLEEAIEVLRELGTGL